MNLVCSKWYFSVFSSLLLLVSLLFTACSKQQSSFTDNDVFRYNEHANISSLDPAFAKNNANIWAVNQLFEGLVQLDDSLHVQPAIAKNWKISQDGKIYTFNLNKNIFFHKHILFGKDSTRAVVAQDFVYSFNRLLSKKVASSGKWVLNNVATYQAANDSTFVIQLKKPFPPFLGLLAMKYCSVVPKEALEFFGNDFRSHPIGTGPFKFKLWVENTKLVFRRNQNYYEKDSVGNSLPYIEAVAITFLPDKQSEFLQFAQGNLDFISGLDPSYKDDLLTVDGKLQARYKNRINMQRSPYLNTEYLGVFLEDKAASVHSILIRKAINYGFDKTKMILYLRNGIGIPAVHGFIPKGLPAFNSLKGYEFNPEKAKALVTQYQKETGKKNVHITIATNAQYADLCEYIQKQLQAIGLETKIDVLPPPVLRSDKKAGKLPVFRASWVADYPDAENYLSLFYSPNFTPNGPNYTHFKNTQFDRWYEQSISTTDTQKRLKLYQQMDSLIVAKAPVVPLYYDEVVRFTQKNIRGLGMNPVNLLKLKRVRKK